MACKLEKCCLCIPLRCAVHAIGFITVLAVLGSIYEAIVIFPELVGKTDYN